MRTETAASTRSVLRQEMETAGNNFIQTPHTIGAELSALGHNQFAGGSLCRTARRNDHPTDRLKGTRAVVFHPMTLPKERQPSTLAMCTSTRLSRWNNRK